MIYKFYHCTGLTSITIPNSVTSIGDYTFYNCTGLTSITIPNSVTSIGEYAFYGTEWYSNQSDGVVYVGKVAYGYKGTMPINTEIVLEEGTLGIAARAFEGCTGLTSITIPESVTSIGYSAFRGCTGLTSITIPESVTSIGYYAFNCSKEVTINSNAIVSKDRDYESAFNTIFGNQVEKYIIGDSVTSIGKYAFYGCTGLTSITISESVTSIGNFAFYGCTGLTSVTIPESVTSIGWYAFEGITLYVKRGTTSLLALWAAGYEPFELDTKNKLDAPYLTVKKTTQTTLTVEVVNIYDEYTYSQTGSILYTGLYPGEGVTLRINISLGNVSYKVSREFRTYGISPSVKFVKTASSMSVEGTYIKGDAHVTAQSITLDNETLEGNNIKVMGLTPMTKHTAKYTITVAYGENERYTTSYSSDLTGVFTDALTITTQQPKVISPGNVIVAAESNLDDEETNVGFEWRRTDWTDDFASNTGGAYLYEGAMEGYIRNLNTEKLWKFRPYYTSNSGQTYYGEWVGLDPTNTSYFEPTVHTYAKISVQGNSAEVRGYAMRGSDNVTSQGFVYWKDSNGVRAEAAGTPNIPSNAQTVEAKGNVMTATLEGLDYESTYYFVAFVTTSEGETFYGEQQSFQTGEDTSGIETIVAKASEGQTRIYDMNGRRQTTLKRGLNIVRMSDGMVRKVFVK